MQCLVYKITLAVCMSSLSILACSKVHITTQTTGDQQVSQDQASGDAKIELTIRERLAKILAAKGVNTKAEETGATVLHYAAMNNQIETLKLLISQKDIDLNPVTVKNKQSPLHAAALGCAGSAASTLLSHADTDATLQNAKGQTAHQLAVEKECGSPEAYRR